MATEQDRLDKLEENQKQMDIRLHVAESNIQEIKLSINKIEGNTSKILWLVGSAIIIALLNLIFKGSVQI